MALAMASVNGFSGSSQGVLEGSLQLSGSGRLSIPKTNRIPLARTGFKVRAQQAQISAPTETSRRAMLGLLAAGFASGSFVDKMVLAETKSFKTVKIAGIAGSISQTATSKGLIRAAIQLAKTIPGLEVEYIDIDNLPMFNLDLVNGDSYPEEVEIFFDKLRGKDGILFASPEYNYSFTAPLKNAIDWASMEADTLKDKTAAIVSTGWEIGGARSQYQLRQVGIRPDIYFINKPELFITVGSGSIFEDNGTLKDKDIERKYKELLISLKDFTIRLRPCREPRASTNIAS
ncbi:NADPH:quinone oxidoreductase-like [Sesamum indicum]|uniref:NAD(P)H dehydrogenase (quinone) n=1 Tax=Sesamum indicum TaxID=4182 RepID=A0A6I9TXG6_SESIN|nr:NADPH:quinone oxidoreductase-like [Sesamum indicum]